MFLKIKPGKIQLMPFSRKSKTNATRYNQLWERQKHQWSLGIFARSSGLITVFEARLIRSVLKYKYKGSLKATNDLSFSIPKTVKAKSSRMGKGKGSFNYWANFIRSNQCLYKLYGLHAKNDGLKLIFKGKSSVKLFVIKKCFRWVD